MIKHQEIQLSSDFAGLETVGEPPDGDIKVLWLHGYTLNSRSWLPIWNLIPGWHHIGVDLPGHGKSRPITDFDNLQDVGRRLGKLCQDEGIRHVVALSFGTVIATQIALEHPDLLHSLTLAAPSLAGAPQDQEVGVAYQKLYAHYYRQGPGEKLKELWMTNPAWRGIDDNPALKQSLGELVALHSWDEIRSSGMLRLMEPVQTADQLESIESPTLILVGDREMPAFRACAETLRQRLPRNTFFILPNTDHLCLLQVPQLAAAHISSHLTANRR